VKASRSQLVKIRDLAYHVRSWGDPDAPKVFMLHGWMDVGASFQFLVDALERDWHVIAPDWRGFGKSAWCADGYWFADYIADLEAIVLLANDYARQGPVTAENLAAAQRDYLPSRDKEMLSYMELLAVFEASNRRMLPPKYANLEVDELNAELHALRARIGSRR